MKPDSPIAAALGETRQEALMRALERERGNITRAARTLGIVRSHAMRLVRAFGLGEFAARLREANGAHRVRTGPDEGKVKGHPVGSKKM